MIRFRALNVDFRLHLLTVLMALLACRLGLGRELLAALPALAAHEGMHLLAAWRLGVPILRLDLMPFGGAAHLGNLYALSGLRAGAVALAGPLGNLLGAMLCATLGWEGLLDRDWAALLVRTNLALLAFNLLPALPLDGGRVLYALLAPLAGEKRALAAGIWLGRLLAAALAADAVAGFLRGGRLNLTMLLAAVFIFAAGAGERAARDESRQAALAAALRRRDGPRRISLIGLDADATLLQAARTLRAGEERLFAVYKQGRLQGFLEQEALLRRLSADDGALQEPVWPSARAGRFSGSP